MAQAVFGLVCWPCLKLGWQNVCGWLVSTPIGCGCCEEKKLSIDDLFKLCETKIEETKGKIKIYKDILKSKKQILLNEDLMQLDDVDISGQVKLKVLEKYDENDIVINKMDFMKILLKYKVVNNFGNINDWLKSTFGNIISE